MHNWAKVFVSVIFIAMLGASIPVRAQVKPGVKIKPHFKLHLPPARTLPMNNSQPALTPFGKRNCRFGDPACNVCVQGLEGQFSRLGVGANGISGRMRFWAHVGEFLTPARQKIEGFDAHHHVEGLARIPDPAAPNWFVLSRAVGKGDAGLLLVQMDRMNGNFGKRMIVGKDLSTYNHVAATGTGAKKYVAIAGTKHAGGIQMLGKLAVVPVNCEGGSCRPWVDIYDLSNKNEPLQISRILLPGGGNTTAYYAAAVRLANGYVYVMVNRSNGADFDQYLSNSTDINNQTKWFFLGRQNLGGFNGFYARKKFNPGVRGPISKDPFAYQNANFVTDCDSGNIYLAALRQTVGRPLKMKQWETANKIDLFKVNFKTAGMAEFSRIGGRSPFAIDWATPAGNSHAGIVSLQYLPASSRKFSSQSGCKMRGGASAYVSPRGDLIVYCGPHTGKNGKLALGEITSIAPRH